MFCWIIFHFGLSGRSDNAKISVASSHRTPILVNDLSCQGNTGVATGAQVIVNTPKLKWRVLSVRPVEPRRPEVYLPTMLSAGSLVAARSRTTLAIACTGWLTYNDRRVPSLQLARGQLILVLRALRGCRLRTYLSCCHQARCLYLRNADPSFPDSFDFGEPTVAQAGMAGARLDGGTVHVVLGQPAESQYQPVLWRRAGRSIRILSHRFHDWIHGCRSASG